MIIEISHIYKSQFGFVKYESVITQLLTCFNCWIKAMDYKEPIEIVHIYFKRAFNKISHIKLIEFFFSISSGLCYLANWFSWSENSASVAQLYSVFEIWCVVRCTSGKLRPLLFISMIFLFLFKTVMFSCMLMTGLCLKISGIHFWLQFSPEWF